MSATKGNGDPEWIGYEILRANQQCVVDVRGHRVKGVRAVMPMGRGLRVKVLCPVHDGGGVAVGGHDRAAAAVEFEGFIEGGLIVSELEVRR